MVRSMFILLLLFTLPLTAQEVETLIQRPIESGGFGGVKVQVTSINKQDAVLVGGVGGWILDHTFTIGGGGYGLVTNVPAKVPDVVRGYKNMSLGYGGVYFEYVESSHKLLHLTFGLLIGAGGIGYRNENSDVEDISKDSFFVLEPNVQMNLNVTHFFRISTGFNYRFVRGVEEYTITSNNDLSTLGVVIVFRFGKF